MSMTTSARAGVMLTFLNHKCQNITCKYGMFAGLCTPFQWITFKTDQLDVTGINTVQTCAPKASFN